MNIILINLIMLVIIKPFEEFENKVLFDLIYK
jgi:hypothetical protein